MKTAINYSKCKWVHREIASFLFFFFSSFLPLLAVFPLSNTITWCYIIHKSHNTKLNVISNFEVFIHFPSGGGYKNLVLLKMLPTIMGLLSFYRRIGVLSNILYYWFTVDNKYGCSFQPVTLLRSCFWCRHMILVNTLWRWSLKSA